ncbi:MAG: hypothetical protein JSU07_03280 [Bacteroidetes bacterium]|nr:hypothetical protein [Bacteroidota bacterium]
MPKPIDWQRDFSSKSKKPMGTFAIYNLLQNTFANEIIQNKKTLKNLFDSAKNNTTLIILNDYANFNNNDVKWLYKYLKIGNKVLIAANYINSSLTDSLHLRYRNESWSYYSNIDSLLIKKGEKIKFNAKNLNTETYPYPQLVHFTYFSNFDSSKFKVNACYNDSNPVLISTGIGKGKLYLLSIPEIFSNYFVVNNPNKKAAYNILSMVSSKTIIWDNYYSGNVINEEIQSPIKFILNNDSLYAAYLILIFTIILYMVFESRRRQKAIPIIEPLNNTTLEFVNVISHVYYNNNGHKYIANEKIKYFYDNIRNRFNIKTIQVDGEFILEIATISGIEVALIKQLFKYCEFLKNSTDVTELELIELYRQINNFNKNSLR